MPLITFIFWPCFCILPLVMFSHMIQWKVSSLMLRQKRYVSFCFSFAVSIADELWSNICLFHMLMAVSQMVMTSIWSSLLLFWSRRNSGNSEMECFSVNAGKPDLKLSTFFMCSCTLDSGSPCYQQFNSQELLDLRMHHLTLERDAVDLVILSQLCSSLRCGDMTQNTMRR